jgi:hypothetical protein
MSINVDCSGLQRRLGSNIWQRPDGCFGQTAVHEEARRVTAPLGYLALNRWRIDRQQRGEMYAFAVLESRRSACTSDL